jgi:hypothetical protein
MTVTTLTRNPRALFLWDYKDGTDEYGRLVSRTGQAITFDRGGTAGTASAVDRNGRTYVPGYKSPRFHHQYSATSGLFEPVGVICEGQRQNLCLQSADLTTTWSLQNPGTRTNNVTGPDGTANGACTVTDNQAATYTSLRQSFVVANDSLPHVASIHILRTTSATTFPGMSISLTGGATIYASLALNTNTGTATARTGEVPTNIWVERDGDFWRVSWSATNNTSGNTTLTLDYYPAVNGDASATWVAATTGSAVFAEPDLEKAAFPSRHIKTTTTPLTRTADSFTAVFNAAPGAMTVYFKVIDYGVLASSGTAYYLLNIGNGATATCLLINAASGKVQGYWDGGGNPYVSAAASPAYGDLLEVRVVVQASGLTVGQTLNSGTEATTTSATAVTFPSSFSSAVLTVGNNAAANSPAFFAAQQVKVASGSLTLAQMRSLG